MPPKAPALWRTLAFWHFGMSQWAMTWVMLISNLCFWTLLSARRIKPALRWLRFFTLTFAFVAVCSAGSWVKQTWWPAKIGVVTATEVAVFAGVHESAVVRFVLHEGVEVLVVEEAPPWVL